MLVEAEGFRIELARRMQEARLYEGLETEKIFAALIVANLSGGPVQAAELAGMLEERERRIFFEILFEVSIEATWNEAESCLEALQRRQDKRDLADLTRQMEANPTAAQLRELQEKKQLLMRRITASGGQ